MYCHALLAILGQLAVLVSPLPTPPDYGSNPFVFSEDMCSYRLPHHSDGSIPHLGPDRSGMFKCLNSFRNNIWVPDPNSRDARCHDLTWFKETRKWNSPDACIDACLPCLANAVGKGALAAVCTVKRTFARCGAAFVEHSPKDVYDRYHETRDPYSPWVEFVPWTLTPVWSSEEQWWQDVRDGRAEAEAWAKQTGYDEGGMHDNKNGYAELGGETALGQWDAVIASLPLFNWTSLT